MQRDGIDGLIYRVIGCMIEVHKELGPGFLGERLSPGDCDRI